MIKLRPYQEKSVSECREALRLYRKVLLQMPTGAGKTVCFSYIAQSSQKYDHKVLILSSRTEILMQNGGALERMGLDVEYVNPRNKKTPSSNVVSGMSQTLKRRVEKEEWREYLQSVNLLVIDESQECVSDFIHDYLNPKCFVLAVSGTPRRYSKMKQLGSMYKAMVTGVSVKELIGLGYLSKAKHYSITAPKLNIAIDKSIGDYNNKALAKAFEQKTLYTGLVAEWMRLTPCQKTICFCVSSTQAIEVTKEFIANGVSAKYLLSGKFDEDAELSGKRDDIIAAFNRSEFTVLVNVMVLTAGFDCPDIRVVICNFATISMTKYRQAIGRGARVCEGKNEFTILDAGANYKTLGMYEDDVPWCLWHDEGSEGGLQDLKECPPTKKDINGNLGCGQEMPISIKVCPNCGYEFRTEKHEYQMHLEEIVRGVDDESNLTIEQYVASKKLEGWSTNRILIQVCLANVEEDKKSFFQAAEVLGLSEYYWSKFKKFTWDKIKSKQELKK